MRKTLLTLAALAGLGLGAAACSTPAENPPAAPVDGPAASSPAAPKDTAKFGGTVVLGGVQVTLKEAGTFTSSEYASPARAKATKYAVTIVNGGTDEISLPSAEAVAGGKALAEVFDSGAGVDGFPGASIQPGETITYTIAFAGAPERVSITPGWFDTAHFVR